MYESIEQSCWLLVLLFWVLASSNLAVSLDPGFAVVKSVADDSSSLSISLSSRYQLSTWNYRYRFILSKLYLEHHC